VSFYSSWVKNSGVSFAWAKATGGWSISDADSTINAVNAKAAGVYIGAYDFARDFVR
jgi:GH25 family lysozyme M1 (1,4-beta-N-acetylmuramidase)